MTEMKVEDYRERRIDIGGWPVNLTTYRLGDVYHTKADNVSPGAALTRTTGATARLQLPPRPTITTERSGSNG